jgi:hypothetical protein
MPRPSRIRGLSNLFRIHLRLLGLTSCPVAPTLALQPLKEHFLTVWFQAIIVPLARSTIEPQFCALVLDLDKGHDLFVDVPLDRDAAIGRVALDRDVFLGKRIEVLGGKSHFVSTSPEDERLTQLCCSVHS